MGRGGDFIPNDTFFDEQWYLNNLGQTGGVTDADIDAVEGWQLASGSSIRSWSLCLIPESTVITRNSKDVFYPDSTSSMRMLTRKQTIPMV